MSLNKSYNYNIGTMGNINVSNLTTGTINASGLSSLTNVTATNMSIGTINASTGITTGALLATGLISSANLSSMTATIPNIVNTNISSGAINASVGITTASISISDLVSSANLSAVTATIPNIIHTNISSGAINASIGITAANISISGLISSANLSSVTATIPNIIHTNISSGAINASVGITTASINVSGLVSSANLSAVTATIPNIIHTNISSGAINASTGITTSSINITGLFSPTNLVSTNISSGTINLSTGITTASININGIARMDGLRVSKIASSDTIPTIDASGSMFYSFMSYEGTSSPVFGLLGGIISSTGTSWLQSKYAWNANKLSLSLNPIGGNVGVNTASPSFPLHVNGGGYITGGITVGNTITLNDSRILLRGGSDAAHGLAWSSGPDGPNLWGNIGGTLAYGSSGATRVLTWNSTGVGVGTNSPQLAFHVVASNVGDTIRIENTNAAGYATAQFKTTTSTYYVGVGGASEAGNNFRDKLYILNPSANGIVLDTNGFCGIGTKTPSFKLDVNGEGRFSSSLYAGGSVLVGTIMNLQTGSSANKGQVYFYSEGEVKSQGQTWLFGANGTLYGPGPYSGSSDTRIKENIVDVDDTSALAIVRQIQPKRYNYVDRQNRGDSPVWGFIAQQVASVLDYAVDTITQFIPNVYESASVGSDNHAITLNDKTTTDFVVGMKIRLIKVDKTPVETSISSIVDNKNFTVECDLTDVKHNNEVFVYGVEVDDFHSLNKDAIFTIATAALQEVDRELQAEKEKTQTLENELGQLKQFIQSKFPGEF